MVLAICSQTRPLAESFLACRLVIMIDSLVKWHSSHGLNMFKHLKVWIDIVIMIVTEALEICTTGFKSLKSLKGIPGTKPEPQHHFSERETR